MDTTTFENDMIDWAEPSTAATADTPAVPSRNDDPLTIALRSNTEHHLDLDDLVYLNRIGPSSRDYPSTVGTLTTTVFSSRKESSMTKPTSAGTSYVVDGYNGKGKGKAIKTYASSLSATHGSGSEAEAEAEHDNVLFGVGDQFENNPLKGAARARKRSQMNRSSRPKKVPLVIHHDNPVRSSFAEEAGPVVQRSSRRSSKETKYLRPRKAKKSDHVFADEEGISTDDERAPQGRFSRARLNVVIGLCVFIAFTFALSVFAAHHTGKHHLACTKGIIFSATVLITVSTVVVMMLARRALQEALLAGLLELVIGFALVTEIRDFMEHVP